jgi:SAM-dependent methyltransferase
VVAEARYDAIVDFYLAGFDSSDDPATVALLDLLGSAAGLRVLDVACGHGRVTRELARRGAEVAGVDISGVLLGRAREAEQAEPLGIRYLQADVSSSAAGLDAAGFDVVTCNFGLSDIDGAAAVISGALRPGGRFVFSILHPCFPGGTDISGSWPTGGRYYDEGRWMPGDRQSSLRRQVGATHRTLSTYLNVLRRQDLWLDEVAEPVPPSDWDARHEADRHPVYLAAAFRKAASGSAPPGGSDR